LSSHVKRLLAAGRREVTLPDSGLEVRLLRAPVYEFMKHRIPMGSLMQAMSGVMWHMAKGEKVPDKLAAQINASSPSFAELAEKLLMACVFQMRSPGEEWERIHLVENDVEADEEKDEINVSAFTQGLTLTDVRTLESAVMDHNGLSKGVEQMFAPFLSLGRTAAAQDGEELRDAPDGADEAGSDDVPDQRGDHDGGGERGSAGAAEGDPESARPGE
jgi:hypothetical protein